MANLNQPITQGANDALARRAQQAGEGGWQPRQPRFYELDDYETTIRESQDYQRQRLEMEAQGVQPPPEADNYLEGWDYKNPQGKGPQGEMLPEGALGWTPFGEPYWGEGAKGWWNGFKNGLKAPDAQAGGELELKLPEGAVGRSIRLLAPGADPALNQLEDVLEWWRGIAGEETPVGTAARVVQETVKSGLGALDVPAQAIERGLGTVALLDAAQRQPLEEKFMAEARRQAESGEIKLPWGRVLRRGDPEFERYVRKLAPPTTIGDYNPDAFARGGVVDTAWQGSRIAYSFIGDPLLREEFIRRYQAGENPDLLAMELENPMKEMVGRVILDPLNFIGAGGTKLRDGSRIASVTDEFLTHSDEIADLAKAVAAGNEADVAKLMGKAADAQVVASKKTAESLSRMGKDYRWTATVADGKRAVVSRRATEVLKNIHANSDTPDDALQMIKALVLMNGSSADEALTGLTIAKRFPDMRIMTSEAANQTGLLIRGLLAGEDGALDVKAVDKFLDTIRGQESVDKAAEVLGARLDSVLEKVFPTVTDMEKAWTARKAGETLSETALDLANRYDKLPKYVKNINRFNRTASSVYRGPNSFFAAVYMGYSPGYAFRNMLTNSLHVAVDEGVSALFKNPKTALEETKELLGGIVPTGARGFGEGLMGMQNVGDFAKSSQFGRRLGEKFEEWAAVQVVASRVRKEMRRMLKPGVALPQIDGLVAAGVPRDVAAQMAHLVLENKGNVDKAVGAIKDALKIGKLDTARTLAWLDPVRAGQLDDFKQTEAVLDALRRATSEAEWRTEIRKVKQAILAHGDKAKSELPVLPNDPAVVERVDNVLENVGDKARHLITGHTAAFEVAEQTVEEAMEGMLKNADPALRQGWDATKVMAKQQHDLSLRFRRQWTTRWYDDWLKGGTGKVDLKKAWDEMGMTGEVPKDWKEFKDAFWNEFYYPRSSAYYEPVLDAYRAAVEGAAKATGAAGADIENALRSIEISKDWNQRVVKYKSTIAPMLRAEAAGRKAEYAGILAYQYGIETTFVDKTTGLVGFNNKRVLDTINKYLPEGAAKYTSLDDVPTDVTRKALARRDEVKAAERLGQAPPAPAGEVAEALPPAPTVAPAHSLDDLLQGAETPYVPGSMPSDSQVINQQRDGLEALFDEIEEQGARNWGSFAEVPSPTREINKAIDDWARGAKKGVAEARIIASNVANKARDFALLSYPEKSYMDVALAYVYPYHFWYNRTYQNWLKRIAYNPQVLANYARFKDYMAKENAGAPEWWKYNINVSELLGIDTDNPFFINPEATLNPLNGLTGVDFFDPYKRVGWFSKLLDDANKFGPSTFTPFSYATALALYLKGEDDAAARWGGRLIPQTAALKSVMNVLNVRMRTGQGLNELDPGVLFFSGGIDPYERNRVGRALGWMEQEGEITPEQQLDIARTQSGDKWYEAVRRAQDIRKWPQLVSFFLGVGFKARTKADIEIDRAQNVWNKLWATKDNYSTDEFRTQLNQVRERYPFMDAVLLSRKGGDDRDRGYAYNVLGRLPPGQLDDLAEVVGINGDMISQFYDRKGDLKGWNEVDRQRFMAGVVTLGALLTLPDDATRAEWEGARNAYNAMRAQVQSDTWLLVDRYYQLKRTDPTGADAFLEANPSVSQTLDWQAAQVMANPQLAQYYGSIDKIERYYKSQMYDAIDAQLGDLTAVWDGYDAAQLQGSKEARAYWNAHPELKKYLELRDLYDKRIAEGIAAAAEALRDVKYSAFREDIPAEMLSQQPVREYIQQAGAPTGYDLTPQDWQERMPAPLWNLVNDYLTMGEDLSEEAQDQLDRIAQEEGLPGYEVLLEMLDRQYTP